MSPDDATNQFLGVAAVADAAKQQGIESCCTEQHSSNPPHNAAALTSSALILAANQRLLAMRDQAKVQRQAETREPGDTARGQEDQPVVPVERVHIPFAVESSASSDATGKVPTSAATVITNLPDHLGWESATMSALLRRSRQTRAEGTRAHAGVEEPGEATEYGDCVAGRGVRDGSVGESTPNLYAKLAPGLPEWVKLYPDLGLGLLRRNMTAPGRLWLFLRALDQSGQGRLPHKATRQALVTATSTLRFCGARQWRNLLRAGEGIFWTWDEGNIWLKATAKVALALGIGGLTGQPVAFPVTAMRQGVGLFRAHLYAAFHSGRAKETPRGRQVMPVARVTLAGLSGVGASSQRTYEKQTRIKVQANCAVGEVATEENRENRVWAQGQAVFELTDHRGQQGKKGETYLAWQLPNCYLGQLQHRPKGRQKRINRELKDLVMQGMPGNVGRAGEMQSPEKRYYPNGKEGVRGCGRGSGQDFYWPGDGVRNRLVRLWQQMAND